MDRDTLVKQMKALKHKARTARKAGHKDVAAAFRDGSSRLLRRIKGLGKPPAAAKPAG